MSRRLMVAAALLLVFAAGCGREATQEGELSLEGREATPPATKAPQASPQATRPAASPSARAAGAQAAPAAPGTAQTPAKAPEGGVNRPKDGRYIYAYKGERTDPFNPAGPPQKFDGERTREISHKGDVYTIEETSSESPGRFTTRTRWEASRILLLAFKTETQVGDFSCTFDPPLVIAKLPFKPETYPTQELKGQGNACKGKLDITIERREDAKDATGRTWSAWRNRIKLQVQTEQGTNTTDTTQWFSPDLGVHVRSNDMAQGEFKTAAGSQKFQEKSETALKKRP